MHILAYFKFLIFVDKESIILIFTASISFNSYELILVLKIINTKFFQTQVNLSIEGKIKSSSIVLLKIIKLVCNVDHRECFKRLKDRILTLL